MLRSATLRIQRITRIRPRIDGSCLLVSTRAATTTSQSDEWNKLFEYRSLLLAAGGLLAGSMVSSSVLVCEESLEQTETKDEEVHDAVEDPYANLPEEDEETDCLLCKTFRKGPCRPSWRKLERCFKDNEESKGAAEACTRYFMGHQECLSSYTNLYRLISLELKQDLVSDTEKAVVEKERLCWSQETSDSFIDWSQWRSFCKDMGKPFQESLNQAAKTASVAEPRTEHVPLWKRVPENTEPLLIATEAKLPTEQDGMLLKFAYAVDQNGMAVGVAYHEYYGKILERHAATGDASSKSEKETTKTNEVPEDDVEVEELPTLGKDLSLEFYILPKGTLSVQLCAFYTEDPTKSDESKKLLDVKLYKTKIYQLKDQC